MRLKCSPLLQSSSLPWLPLAVPLHGQASQSNHIQKIYLVASTQYGGILYIGSCLIFLLLDLAFPTQKLHPQHPSSISKFIAVVPLSLLNLTIGVITPVYLLFAVGGARPPPEELPTSAVFVRDFIASAAIFEVLFYYGHRLLHHGALYKWVHRVHHSYRHSFALVGAYTHPLEFSLFNVVPMMAGPTLTRCHVFTQWVWTAMSLVVVAVSHSDFNVPFMPKADRHGMHHLRFNKNFGATGFLDWLHGTAALEDSGGDDGTADAKNGECGARRL
ncbi:hypothetical protein DFJ73DRAFT_659865 [Zopfochytrium polystomum]|nr:hypothetical protein DFJ73DRAFT_659865 [Zopfochytrium polystomum]